MKYNYDMGNNWYALRWKVLERDNFTCRYCGQHAPDVILHVDHILAKANGGSDHEDNLVTSCAACNIGKGTIRLKIERAKSSKKPRGDMVADMVNYLTTQGPATGTEIAKSLGYSRQNIAEALSKSGIFSKSHKIERNVYYRVST